MLALNQGHQQAEGITRSVPARLVSLLILVGAAIIVSLTICELLTAIVGPLPMWLWYGIHALQILPAIFLAGALFASGPSEPLEVS
jgi:hypothetical protein